MSLVEDAVKAKQLGFKSYGEYMKTKGEPPRLVRFQFEGPVCWECGLPLPKGRQKFCSEECIKKRRRKRRETGVFV